MYIIELLYPPHNDKYEKVLLLSQYVGSLPEVRPETVNLVSEKILKASHISSIFVEMEWTNPEIYGYLSRFEVPGMIPPPVMAGAGIVDMLKEEGVEHLVTKYAANQVLNQTAYEDFEEYLGCSFDRIVTENHNVALYLNWIGKIFSKKAQDVGILTYRLFEEEAYLDKIYDIDPVIDIKNHPQTYTLKKELAMAVATERFELAANLDRTIKQEESSKHWKLL